MSHLPDAIHVRVLSRDTPLSSMLVLTRIVMHELNDYWGIFGPTDSDGFLTILREDLELNAARTKEFYADEFADLETSLSGLIEVRILDEEGITRALEAADSLTDYPYDANYRQMLNDGLDHLVGLGRVLLEFEVTSEGGDCEVKAAKPI